MNDGGKLIKVDSAATSRTIWLPEISTLVDGFKVSLFKTQANNEITIRRFGSDTINGDPSVFLSSKNSAITLVADTSNNSWSPIGLSHNVITSANIVDGTILAEDLANDAIDSQHYTDGSIDLVHLSADAVDGTKIADNAIDSEHYVDGSIDLVHMSANSVDSDQYVDGSIDGVHLSAIALNAKDINMADAELMRPMIKDYSEEVNALGGVSGAAAIDLSLGNVVTATVTGATTFTFGNPPVSGKSGSMTLLIVNGGSQTVTWPASIVWAEGLVPALTVSGIDALGFMTVNGGGTWYGFTSLNFS
jgi:hypothetical protein